ncbi:dTDP-4-dehydrorhamnose 3,5-epimerase family protein [Rhodobacter capsulatus]|uniref:dTDP-4-dehydrorhamnose 3,5-epimerase family protein n=1 Tax=Rhodobacter capsulatus TaxID=1061 RepID=UPI00402508DB
MQIQPTPLAGVYEIAFPAHADARGSFRRTWCADSFTAAGIVFTPVQASQSRNPARHTLRGMHWQAEPQGEQKLVRVSAGAIFDVALDLRPGSPTFRRWHGVHLDAAAGRSLFLPRGVAHGFLTLSAEAVVDYLIDAPHAPEAARGVRWNDPAFGILWPGAPAVISDRDAHWPVMSDA